MNTPEIKKICVVGAGVMGQQIAMNTAIHGYTVTLNDVFPAACQKAEKWIEEYLEGRISKGRMTAEEAYACRERLTITERLEDAVIDAQIVIEAIIENKEIKMDFYKKIDKLVASDVLLASNSSYMVSSTFKDCVTNPSRLANFHFFNPALVMKLVEIVAGEHTAPETISALADFARNTGKTPIILKKECDGFVVNRILRAQRDEAYRILEEGICTPEEIDIGVELGLGYPMGVFKLNDITGIDSTYEQNERRYKETGIKPAGYDIVKEKYLKGEYGKKTGKGFYTYK